jgi:mono/diheme cytochrome c family protein
MNKGARIEARSASKGTASIPCLLAAATGLQSKIGNVMQTRISLVVTCAIIVIGLAIAIVNDSRAQSNQDNAAADANTRNDQSSIERGMYIVHHVAMCVYCHTPKDADGQLDEQQLLHGAPIPVESPFPRVKWAFQAPKIAGLPGGWTEEELVRFLQTGVTPTGRTPQPPMPPFRMNDEDARAVAAYLSSL